jgi:hypothetical protein
MAGLQEAHEVAETVVEAGHGHGGAHPHDPSTPDGAFRRNVGLLIGVLACLMAITTVAGANMMKQTINANIEASDTYAFYQAKTLRQQVWLASSDTMEALRLAVPDLPPAAKAFIDARQEAARKNIARWESAPETQDGKQELLRKAAAAIAQRDAAREHNEWFEIAEAMLQIAVVVASTAVLTLSRRLLTVCLVFAAIGVVASLNGFIGVLTLPF